MENEADTFTIQKLREAMDKVKDFPPPPFFGSSKMLSADHFVKFKHGGRDYVGGHPDLWAKFPAYTLATPPGALGSVDIINLDVAKDRMTEFGCALSAAMQAKSKRPFGLRMDLTA